MGDAAQQILAAYPQAGAELAAEIEAVAARLGAHPFDLANLINFESAKTFGSAVKNPVSGATGLIQFMPSTAKSLGTTTDALAQLSPVQQMVWVEKYLAQYKKIAPLSTVQALYMSVFYPKAMTWTLETEFPANVQAWNPGIRTVADYVGLANRSAKLPPSSDVRASTFSTLAVTPLYVGQLAVRRVPWWGWTGGALLALILFLFAARAWKRRRKPYAGYSGGYYDE